MLAGTGGTRRALRERLMALSPRGFELFTSDLLTYVGLQNIVLTRYVGDGGVDAHGDLIAESGLMKVPTGVQVKRHRKNVQRADIDQFIGALGGQYRHGIFITTADYSHQARVKAEISPVVRIETVSGDNVLALMVKHHIGLDPHDPDLIDEEYFAGFEARVTTSTQPTNAKHSTIPAASPDQQAIQPADDLISLRALSYELRVDLYTVRDWVVSGKLPSDLVVHAGQREVYFIRRNRIEHIRRQFVGKSRPVSSHEWRQDFLNYAGSRNLTKSYKPVVLSALLRLANRDGEVLIDELVQEFLSFYVRRQRDGLIAEYGVALLADPSTASRESVKRLLIRHPLERFIIKGFLLFDAATGIIRFTPHLWNELRFFETKDLHQSLAEQLRYYYERPR